ncbi:MAG: iron ABC transporter permease [Oscillospiraceae bacterium]|nr:iron ABC transporter permease [Oscillospiraceae bacterium]MDD4368491.1 iron ABC transporter permease [Oscillospiraceae bacterium]
MLGSIAVSVRFGIAGGSWQDLSGSLWTARSSLSPTGAIMLQMRLPRVVAAAACGAAFASAANLMQGLTLNPLADAGLLGINAGAGLLLALAEILWPGHPAGISMLAAFSGALLAVLLVYSLGQSRSRPQSPLRLILAGAAVSALLTALTQALALSFNLSKELSFWTSGSLSGVTWQGLKLTLPGLAVASLLSLPLSGFLSVLALGQSSAQALGINLKRLRLAGLALVLVLAGSSVMLAGGIAYLGLIVPHIARRLTGADYRRQMPATGLLGASLLVWADLAARLINAPYDTPVGALVSLLGVPVYLILIRKNRAVVS